MAQVKLTLGTTFKHGEGGPTFLKGVPTAVSDDLARALMKTGRFEEVDTGEAERAAQAEREAGEARVKAEAEAQAVKDAEAADLAAKAAARAKAQQEAKDLADKAAAEATAKAAELAAEKAKADAAAAAAKGETEQKATV